ncbi:hypothetical protein LTR53_001358 [Teratosphaeriaceae sp. CCFEE 6253]|nr:hypothetical protein LTR53_001358 [Teratosphaeriaceae sp. CCFEE 6253]
MPWQPVYVDEQAEDNAIKSAPGDSQGPADLARWPPYWTPDTPLAMAPEHNSGYAGPGSNSGTAKDAIYPYALAVSASMFPALPQELSVPPLNGHIQRQKARFEGDLYSATWVCGAGAERAGWCSYCSVWLKLRDSAYWYHMQYTVSIGEQRTIGSIASS